MSKITTNENLVKYSNQTQQEQTQIINKLKNNKMRTIKNNENLVNSNQPQQNEFYKELSIGKVFNLNEVLEYNWVKNGTSKENIFNKITSSGDYIIWEFGNSDEPVDELFRMTNIEEEIDEFILNDNRTDDDKEEFIDYLLDEYKDKLEEFTIQVKTNSMEEIDMNNISNYFVGLDGEMNCDGYDIIKSKVDRDLLIKIKYELNN